MSAKYTAASSNLFRLDLDLSVLAFDILAALQRAPMPLPDNQDPEALTGRIIACILNHCEVAADRFIRTLLADAITSLTRDRHASWEAIARPDLYIRSDLVADTFASGDKEQIDTVMKKICRQAKHMRRLDRHGPKAGNRVRLLATRKDLHDLVEKRRRALAETLTDRDARHPDSAKTIRAIRHVIGVRLAKNFLAELEPHGNLTNLAIAIVRYQRPEYSGKTIARHYREYERLSNMADK
jgi:hypothetical protein